MKKLISLALILFSLPIYADVVEGAGDVVNSTVNTAADVTNNAVDATTDTVSDTANDTQQAVDNTTQEQ